MKYILTIPLVLAVMCATGCYSMGGQHAVEPQSEDQEIPAQHIDLVAMNLIFSLSQLAEIRPRTTTVQFSEPRTEFGRIIERRLVEAGYGVQRVKSDVGSNYVRYKYVNSITEAGPITEYSLSVGVVGAKRNYIVKNGDIFPDSEMILTGAEEKQMEINDLIFEDQVETHEYPSLALFESTAGPKLVVLTSADGGSLDSGEQSGADVSSSFAASVRQNIHDNNEVSNYATVFEDYIDVRNAVLIFANDKMTVGVNNKKVLQSFARDYQPETDIISVIGCSHGATALAAGNAGLATGRANRVKEELIFSNVPYNQISEEGCWGSGASHSEFPARGVVVTLKRQAS